MIHLYCGDGKGKTTAAIGLAVRMAGRGKDVIVAQFMKSEDSGERRALEQLPHVVLLDVPEQVKFSSALTPEEHHAESLRSQSLLDQAAALSLGPNCGLLVLDEVCGAVSAGLLSVEAVLSLLDTVKAEVVLTGRDPHPALETRADYITLCQKIRHPFDRGIPARSGVEF